MMSNHRIGLALGSGGPKGLAHIGVIKALQEKKIPIHMIAGTSAGAVIGGLFCALGTIDKVESIFTTLTLKDLTLIFSDIRLKSGVIKGQKIEEFLNKYLRDINIENLSLPFMALATDINSGEPIQLTKGNLARAVRASSTIPGLIGVVDYANHQLVDGGVSEPVPVKGVRSLGADHVIAVNLDQYHFVDTHKHKHKMIAPTVGITAIKLLRYHLSQEKIQDADVKIEPLVHDVTWANLATISRRKAIIQSGFDATMKELRKVNLFLDHNL